MTSWDLLKYLYFGSCIAMMVFILQKTDQMLISYGMMKKDEKEQVSFTTMMVMMVVFSPFFWIVILTDKNQK